MTNIKRQKTYLITTRYDRAYSSWPAWYASLLNVRTRVWIGVAEVEEKCCSDHAPLSFAATPKRRLEKSVRPVPRWIAEHPKFGECFNELVPNTNLEKLSPFDALDAIKPIMRRASKVAMREVLSKDPTTPASKLQLVLQMSRAIVYQDAKLATLVARDLPEVGRFLRVDAATGRVSVSDQSALDDITQKLVRAALEVESEVAASGNPKSKQRGEEWHRSRAGCSCGRHWQRKC